MKKQVLGLLGAVGMLGLGLGGNVVPAGNQSQQNQSVTQQQNNGSSSQSQQQSVSGNQNNGPVYKIQDIPHYSFNGKDVFPPKQYGMYLQRSHKQKWTKKA